MAYQPLISPTTGAVSTKADLPDTSAFPTINIVADALATTETFTVYAKLPSGNYGVVGSGTATAGQVTLPGSGSYAVTKAATASACGVWWSGNLAI